METHSTLHGWETKAFFADEHVVLSENVLIFTTLLAICLVAQYLTTLWNLRYISPSTVTVLLSMIIGGIIRLGVGLSTLEADTFGSPFILGFSTKVFYFVFLPPILFNAGFHVKRKPFFNNFDAIFSLAIFGTFVAILLTASAIYVVNTYLSWLFPTDVTLTWMECIAFGAVISSTDPVSTLAIYNSLHVEKNLFYLVFGESILNDAVAITVYKIASRFVGVDITTVDILFACLNFVIIFLGSALIGYGIGIITAYVLGHFSFLHDPITPIALLFCTMYIPFLLTETLQLSGIVALFFTGIATRRYAIKNIDVSIKHFASFCFELVSYICETSCFLLLGLSIFLNNFASFRLLFILLVFVICIIARCMQVYVILSAVNIFRFISGSLYDGNRSYIPVNHMHMIFLAGLRGAIAYALAYSFPNTFGNRAVILSTTGIVVLLTILIFGGMTEPAIKHFKIQREESFPQNSFEEVNGLASPEKSVTTTMLDFERSILYPIILKSPSSKSQHNISTKFMSPMRYVTQSSGGGSIGWDELENPPNDSPTPCFPGMDELMSMQIQDERPTKEQEETLFLRV